MKSNNLLVVDWDYFFENPLEGGEVKNRDDIWLFDWGHRESPFFIDAIWPTRAAGFLKHDLPLPSVDDAWKKFASRFKLTPKAKVYVADSNVYAAALDINPQQVWLYDAHHDCYGGAKYSEWVNKFFDSGHKLECGNWMLYYHLIGSELHYRWPIWHKMFTDEWNDDSKKFLERIPDGVKLDAQPDDTPPDIKFNNVFICRSGAWVPPWCDQDFISFVHTWGRSVHQLGGYDSLIRDFKIEDAQEEVEMQKRVMELAKNG